MRGLPKPYMEGIFTLKYMVYMIVSIDTKNKTVVLNPCTLLCLK